MREKIKIVYKDGQINKLIFGFFCGEDEHFYTVEADKTGTVFKINKNAVISLKFLGNVFGGGGND